MIATPLLSFSTGWKNFVVLVEALSAESRSSAGIADASPREEAAGALAAEGAAATARRGTEAGTDDRLCSIAACDTLAFRLARVDAARADRAVEVPPLRIARRNAMPPLVRVCRLAGVPVAGCLQRESVRQERSSRMNCKRAPRHVAGGNVDVSRLATGARTFAVPPPPRFGYNLFLVAPHFRTKLSLSRVLPFVRAQSYK